MNMFPPLAYSAHPSSSEQLTVSRPSKRTFSSTAVIAIAHANDPFRSRGFLRSGVFIKLDTECLGYGLIPVQPQINIHGGLEGPAVFLVSPDGLRPRDGGTHPFVSFSAAIQAAIYHLWNNALQNS